METIAPQGRRLTVVAGVVLGLAAAWLPLAVFIWSLRG